MKKIISITAIFMALMISCTKVDVADNNTNPLPMPEKAQVAVQGLGVTPKANYVVVGEPVQLEVSVSPEEAVAGTVSWTSSDPAVATVDAEGKVTTLSVGIARITAAVEGASATAIVNVFAERVPATEIKLNKTEITLLAGRATKVKATLLPDGSVEGEPATTDQLNLEWSSSNENVAIVSYGFIQAKGMGEATITAKQGDLTATVAVTVADKIKLVDRSEAWPIIATPKWDKNWSGKITGSHEEVGVTGVDAAYNYMAVVAADKFVSIEEAANAIYEQVEEKKDAGESPKSLFGTGESRTVNYSDLGNAVAYVLGYDEEFEFTGEYSKLEFEAKTPDPVHATGIQFTSGWNDTPIDKIELKEGKNLNYFGAKLLPDDCTDTGDISYKSSDESVVVIKPYYSGYYTVTAVAAGEAEIIATFNNITASIPVVVTGSSVVWTDKSSEWTGSFGDIERWGSAYFGFTLTSCTSPKHYMFMAKATSISGDLVAYMKSTAASNEDWLSYYASDALPDQTYDWSGSSEDEYYAFVVGVDASGSSFDGNYAIFHYDPNAGSGSDEPGGETSDVIVSFNAQGQYLQATFDDIDAVQDELTLEGWFNPSSLSGGGDNIRVLWGTEGIFLLRYENAQLNLVYGGTKRTDKNEYAERKATYTTNLSTNVWHHIAATYKRNDKAILYVDGVEVASNTAEDHGIELNGLGAQWDLPFSFIIGAAGQAKRNFLGSMYGLRVWDCARTATEIADNMNTLEPADEGFNLIAAWNFDEGSGNTITDHGATGDYNITSNGTLAWIEGTLPF